MATYFESEKRLLAIAAAFKKIDEAAQELEAALAAVRRDDYEHREKDFIDNMGCFHGWISDPLRIYRSDVADMEAGLSSPKLATYALRPGLEVAGATAPITKEELTAMADEDGFLIGAE